jgi:subtilisin family serine protease
MSGTSTASPHVAGLAALYLEQHPAATPAEVQAAIVSNATVGIVSNGGLNSPNLFAYSPTTDAPPPSGCQGTLYNGSLSGSGSSDYQSSSSGFNSAAGRFQADISMPTGASFSVSLEKKSGNKWSSVGTSFTGSIQYKGKSGTYRWKIGDVSGSGAYALCAVTP